MLDFFDIPNHTQLEVTEQVSRMMGPIAHKLSKIGLLDHYKDDFVEYFNEICNHEELSIQQLAVFNLPCMHLLLKDD